MSSFFDSFGIQNEVDYFQGRVPGRTYISNMFEYNCPNSKDIGFPARNINQVFDCDDIDSKIDVSEAEWESRSMNLSPRRQIKISIAKEAGHYKELVIQQINPKKPAELSNLLRLTDRQVDDFLNLIRCVGMWDPVDVNLPKRLDATLLQRMLDDNGETLGQVYSQQPDKVRELIKNDPSGEDVAAVASRRKAVIVFEEMMQDGSLTESAWQDFFENNPWILGAGLGVPLFTAWNSDKLETVVRGNSFTGKGKRVDALYQTSGIVKSLVFAEIKKPTTKLLTNDEYRPGCWAASKDLSGGIFQVHATVQAAEDEVSEHVVTSQDEEGCDIPSSEVFLFRPRAYLVIGSTKEFINENSGGKNREKIRSFELFRSSIVTPEIITYDELLAKARWLAYGNDDSTLTNAGNNQPN